MSLGSALSGGGIGLVAGGGLGATVGGLLGGLNGGGGGGGQQPTPQNQYSFGYKPGDTGQTYSGTGTRDFASWMSSAGYATPTSQAQEDYLRHQYAGYQTQQTGNKTIGDWQNQQNDYASNLSANYMKSATPAIQQDYADALKKQQLQAASSGQLGGSASLYQQGQLSTAEQGQLAQAQYQAQMMQVQQQQQDSQTAQQWRMSLAGSTPFAGQAAGVYQSSQGALGSAAMQSGQQSLAGLQAAQQTQDYWSQIYGSQLGNLGQGLSQYGQMQSYGGYY